ncbi:class I SAM-dependent methyltransferase [Micromonospora sp. 4G57]|uniref:Class I SAM-dependent methyltransferase n=1 Tax=Micromonospora sicca TaxID=2202420 RepID=A0A317DQ85_9ACTN|nr:MULTISPECIES: class I SAM-dependent methyltransferase [unclassified Micromonospora]MDZ5443048.1 class I SAM-dependent methyltransferase [Micromonospora sp. 4G57]MDZ5488240.1 class I SAM-dependent methyltransferase [Micromonospora sp. 4G53]PWR16250.1 class I SAM-dependent methyltransferase [Micromonospora sp. 4G51]
MPEPPAGGTWRGAQAHGRRANRRSYHDGARVNGYVDDPYHRIRRAVAARMVAEGVTGRLPVLELGCGPRGMLDPADLPVPLVLADLAETALRDARRAAGPGALPACLDATRGLPFRAGSFGGLVTGELIEHVYDPVALLRECHRVLAPGGLLVLTTPNLATVQDRVSFLLGRAPRQVDPLHPYLWLHIRPFTASLLRRVLRRAGFVPLAIRSNQVGWRLPSGRWVTSRLLARVAPGLGGSLICAARRAAGPPSPTVSGQPNSV